MTAEGAARPSSDAGPTGRSGSGRILLKSVLAVLLATGWTPAARSQTPDSPTTIASGATVPTAPPAIAAPTISDFLALFDKRISESLAIGKAYRDETAADVSRLRADLEKNTALFWGALSALGAALFSIGYLTIHKFIKSSIEIAVRRKVTERFILDLVKDQSAALIQNTSERVTLLYQGITQFNLGDHEGAYRTFLQADAKGYDPLAKSHLAFLADRLQKPETGEHFEEIRRRGAMSEIDLINYSFFLRRRRGDNLAAIALLREGCEASPGSLALAANLVCARLLEPAQREAALAALAGLLAGDVPNGTVELELRFVSLVYRDVEAEARTHRMRIASLLQAGLRSRYWDFESHLQQARVSGHRRLDWLRALAAAMVDGSAIDLRTLVANDETLPATP